jgi:uncharacterized protein (DUF2249 family)
MVSTRYVQRTRLYYRDTRSKFFSLRNRPQYHTCYRHSVMKIKYVSLKPGNSPFTSSDHDPSRLIIQHPVQKLKKVMPYTKEKW